MDFENWKGTHKEYLEALEKHRKTRRLDGTEKRLRVKGWAPEDKLFKKRLKRHKEQTQKFYEEHPELGFPNV